MSDVTWYAWAPISHKNEDGSDASLKPGDKVTSEFLSGLEDDDLVATWKKDGVIRTNPFPKNVPQGMTVRNHLIRKAKAEYEEATSVGSPQKPEKVEEAPLPTVTTTAEPTPNAPQG